MRAFYNLMFTFLKCFIGFSSSMKVLCIVYKSHCKIAQAEICKPLYQERRSQTLSGMCSQANHCHHQFIKLEGAVSGKCHHISRACYCTFPNKFD